LNNSNRNNNRRRGRGSNRGQGGGGQTNRIDSRARGNAPQMLEKYRKLAHDASLNDDRVQTEYYLQFADHYFRVISDMKSQRDEQRPRRDGDRDPSTDYGDEEDFDREEMQVDRRPRDEGRRDDDGEVQAESRDDDSDEDDVAESNPFVRDVRQRRPRSRDRSRSEREAPVSDGVDPSVLPPSIARDEDSEAPRKPARAPRARRAPPTDDGDGEALEAVN
jgi:hypothetical protein